MSGFLRDVRTAWRTLRQRPAFTLVVVLTLALAIGANASVFSLVSAVLFTPPAVEQPSRLMNVYVTRPDGSGLGGLSYPEYRDIQAGSGALFRGLLGYSGLLTTLTGDGPTEVLFGEIVTSNYFSLLGVRPLHGRGFVDEKERSSGDSVDVVIGHALWRRRFGSDPRVIGRQVILNGHPCTVVGVAPPGFTGVLFPGFSVDVWAPVAAMGRFRTDQRENRGERWMFVKARLADRVRPETVDTALSVLGSRLERDHPDTNAGRRLRAIPSSAVYVHAEGDRFILPAAGFLILALAAVLLVACSNIGGLMVARAWARRREVAIRKAMGARRFQVLSPFLAEALLLATAGGVAGVVVASWLARLLVAFRPPLPVPLAFNVRVDWRVAAFTAVLTALTTLSLSVLPPVQAARSDLFAELAWGGDRKRRRWGMGHMLLVPQVALSMVLLVLAMLFGRSVLGASIVDAGFAIEHTAFVSLHLGMNGYDETSARRFYERLIDAVQALPGVERAALTSRIPLDLYGSQEATVEVEDVRGGLREHRVQSARVGAGYFETLGIPLSRGRAFERRDAESAADVAIVSAAAARLYWPKQDPIGRRLRQAGRWLDVVGVASDVKVQSLSEDQEPLLYVPIASGHTELLRLIVRVRGNPSGIAPALRRAVDRIDARVGVFECDTLASTRETMLYPYRMASLASSAIGMFGLILAVVGLYGAVAWAAASRTREMGIRMALGAGPARLVADVVRDSAVVVLIGAAIGLALAAGSARVAGSWLFGIEPLDPLTFLVVPASLLLLSSAAAYLPARRAAVADPARSLRSE